MFVLNTLMIYKPAWRVNLSIIIIQIINHHIHAQIANKAVKIIHILHYKKAISSRQQLELLVVIYVNRNLMKIHNRM